MESFFLKINEPVKSLVFNGKTGSSHNSACES
jgi:hypothetical protein